MTERSLHVAGPAGQLEGRLHLPEGAPRLAAVVCHPHPLYGGDMDSHVVVALATALAADGTLALRFNFRGVGASAGAHDDGRGEQDDVVAAAHAVRTALAVPAMPLAILGYSFGAAAGLAAAGRVERVACAIGVSPTLGRRDFSFVRDLNCPVLLVWGEDDAYVDPDAAGEIGSYGNVRTVVVPQADHFWSSKLDGAVEAVVAFVRTALAGAPDCTG